MRRRVIKEARPQYSKRINHRLLTIIIYIPSLLIIIGTTVAQKCLHNRIMDFLGFWGVNSVLFVCNLHDDIDFLGTAVWTLTTILSAIVILYYSIINYRNFGFTNRQIISYTYGSHTIPVLVIYNTIIVLIMTIVYYTRYYIAFYLLAMYSIFIQLFLIFICIFSTTRYIAYKTILKIEKKNLEDYCKKIQENKEDNYEALSMMIEREKESLPFSLYNVMNWEETLAEKVDIIGKILIILFDIDVFCENEWDMKYYNCIYRYQQNNFKILATYIDKEKDSYVVHELYSIIYKNIRWIREKTCLNSNRMLLFVWYGSLFNAFIPKKSIEDKWNMLTYIADDFFRKEVRQILILELIFAIQFQIYIGNLELEEETEISSIVKSINRLPDFIDMDLKKIFYVHENMFQNLILSWAGNTTEKRSNHYEIYAEMVKAIEGKGRHDFIDYMIKLKEGI